MLDMKRDKESAEEEKITVLRARMKVVKCIHFNCPTEKAPMGLIEGKTLEAVGLVESD